jgi:hypothetical protein
LLAAASLAAQPDAALLVRGRTIFIEDATIDRLSLGPAKDAIGAWKHFTLVTSREGADLVLTIGQADLVAEMKLPTSSADPRTPKRVFTAQVVDRVTGERLWSGNRDSGLSQARTLRALVNQFRQFVEKKKP